MTKTLHKTLAQPWFAPYTRPSALLTEPMRIHREGMKQLTRRDVHDRSDVWYVVEDGSNLEEVVDDLTHVVETVGLPFLARTHMPATLVKLASSAELSARPDAPIVRNLLDAATRHLETRPGDLASKPAGE